MIQFTGNWYIDMGILGMLNLLKEQFPEKEIDEIIQKSVGELKDDFSYAYLKAELNKRKISNEDTIKKFEKKIINSKKKTPSKKDKKEKERENLEKERIKIAKLKSVQPYRNEMVKAISKIESSTVWDNLSGVYKKENFQGLEEADRRLPLDSNVYKNLWFFNTSKKFTDQKQLWRDIVLKGDFDAIDNKLFDKTIDKLLASSTEMANATFAKIDLSDIKNAYGDIVSLSLLSIPFAFNSLAGKSYFFYSSDMKFTFLVNQSLSTRIKQAKGNESEILKITYQAVFDTLYQYKSTWALNNMQIISFKKLDNQGVDKFDFIGIDKIEASILIDDKIRESLNVAHSKGKKQPKSWIIKDFIEKKSLLEILFRICVNDEYVSLNTVCYSVAVELNKKFLSKDANSKAAFQIDFFQHQQLKLLPINIHETVRLIRGHNFRYYQIIAKQEVSKKQSEARYLISLIKENASYRFVNFIMKKMLLGPKDERTQNSKMNLTSFLFKYIISNPYWQYYALGLIFKNFNQTSHYEQSINNE